MQQEPQHQKKRLYYQRQPTNESDILSKKDPSEMTEEEKVIWKVRVFRECEATEDIIKGAIDMI